MSSSDIRTLELNMGPQHPSTHGVLRLILRLNGEIIEHTSPRVGYLHRGFEKMAENMSYQQFTPVTDRLSYVASMNNNLAYAVAIEKLLGAEDKVPERAQYIRVMVAELNRIASHLIWLGTHALDIGAMTPYFYCFREREMIVDMFEEICGARLLYNYVRIGGVAKDITPRFMDMLKEFVKIFPERQKDYHTLLTKNRIWLKRTKDVGVVSKEDAINWGISGPALRGSGIEWDLRKKKPYAVYSELDFDIPYYPEGDVYARYLVRMDEMLQSIRILEQCINKIPEGPYMAEEFAKVSKPIKPPAGEAYGYAENPTGELGFYVISEGKNKPYRMKIRAPSFIHAYALPFMIKGLLLADVVAVIGSFDLVFGESDR
jgi:NADH-quinone oxidoreductase subunit D